LPGRKPWRVPWGGFELVFAFVFVAVVPELLQKAGVSRLAAGVLALPIQLAILYAAWQLLYPAWKPGRRGSGYVGLVAVAVAVWAVLAPVVLLVNAAVLQVFTALDWQPDAHPLTKLAVETPREQVLFMAQACVAAPLFEEVMFRGLLLPWVIGARERNTGGLKLQPVAPPVGRPLVVMAIAALYTAGSPTNGPVIFAGVLTLGLAVLWVTVRCGKRHVRGVYASAALFAVVHSTIWPSPIPLFILGLGLGWLAVRTRGVLAPAIVHGLFNAVSAVFVLRGAA
jgi:membrane protease YdiL (CAAX protease family)